MLNLFKVGGYSNSCLLNSAEMFDCSTQEWKMISDMYTRRIEVGVGVLNDLLYVVNENCVLILKRNKIFIWDTMYLCLLFAMQNPKSGKN